MLHVLCLLWKWITFLQKWITSSNVSEAEILCLMVISTVQYYGRDMLTSAHFETYLMANRADPDQLASET